MEGYQKYVVLCAVTLINCSLNVTYYIGNLSTYIISLRYNEGQTDSFDIDVNWFVPAYMISRMLGSFVADYGTKTVGLRLMIAFGIFLSTSSTFLTYFAVRHSVWVSTLTFTFVGGLGNSVIFMCDMMYVAAWFDQGVGFASALPCSAGAVGGIVMNQIVTRFINPRNLSPDTRAAGEDISFFSQQEIIDSVPMVFVVMGAVTAGFQLIGFCFLRKPRKEIVPPCEEETGLLTDVKQRDIDTHGFLKYTEGTSGLSTAEEGSVFEIKEEDQMPLLDNSLESTFRNEEDRMPIQYIENGYMTASGLQLIKSKVDEDLFKTPLEVLKSPPFYYLQCAVIAQSIGFFLVTNYYKFFGQLWINDDDFFAYIGSCTSFFVIPSIIVCGAIFDKFGVKKTYVGHMAASTVLFCLWYFSAMSNKWLYLILVVLMYCSFMNQFLLMTLSTLWLFGKPHYGTNFGLVQISSLFAYFLGPPLATYALSSVGWFWMFFITGALTFVLMMPVLLKMNS